MNSMILFMTMLFVLSIAMSANACSLKKAGLAMRLFRYFIGCLSIAGGWFFATLFCAYAKPESVSMIVFPFITVLPGALGVVMAHWTDLIDAQSPVAEAGQSTSSL